MQSAGRRSHFGPSTACRRDRPAPLVRGVVAAVALLRDALHTTIIARGLAFTGLVTLGQALLLLLGELDISLGAIGGLSGVVAGILMVGAGFDPFVAMALAILLGAVLGFVNGALVTTLGLHSLVLTIAMAGVYKGVNLVLTKGVAITNIPESTVFLGRGDVGPLPTPFVIMLGLAVVIAIVAHRTPFGRYIYAIGDAAAAARMIGIKVDRIKIAVFVIAGSLAALAGTLMVARLGDRPAVDRRHMGVALDCGGGHRRRRDNRRNWFADRRQLGAGIIAIIEQTSPCYTGYRPIGRA